MKATDQRERRSRKFIADEYDRLADAIEVEAKRLGPQQATS